MRINFYELVHWKKNLSKMKVLERVHMRMKNILIWCLRNSFLSQVTSNLMIMLMN
jgi:hypothetical protein